MDKPKYFILGIPGHPEAQAGRQADRLDEALVQHHSKKLKMKRIIKSGIEK